MKIRHQLWSIGCSAILIAGCTSSSGKVPFTGSVPLHKGTDFELFSLDADHDHKSPGGGFHDWKILGTTKITDAAVRAALVDAFDEGVENHDGSAAACFNPRHGIRVKYVGKSVDFLICFECS